METVSLWGTISAVGGASGFVALLGWAFSYGKIVQRLTTVEQSVERVRDLGDKVSVIEERSRATNETVKDIKSQVDKLVERMLDDKRNDRGHRPS